MNNPELQSRIHILSSASAARIDQVFRELRARGLIPTMTRGESPPVMTTVHAAVALTALAIDEAPVKAADAVGTWLAMPARDNSTVFVNFGFALDGVLRDQGAVLNTREVRICRDWPFARIIAGDEGGMKEYDFGPVTAREAHRPGYRLTPIRSEFVLSGAALHQLAIDLADEPDEAGIVG